MRSVDGWASVDRRNQASWIDLNFADRRSAPRFLASWFAVHPKHQTKYDTGDEQRRNDGFQVDHHQASSFPSPSASSRPLIQRNRSDQNIAVADRTFFTCLSARGRVRVMECPQ